MAVTAKKSAASMKMVFDNGVDPNTGKTVTKIKSFPNISESATDEGLYQASQALSSLQIHPVVAIRKQETYELINE